MFTVPVPHLVPFVPVGAVTELRVTAVCAVVVQPLEVAETV